METPGETPQPGVPGGIPLPRRGGPDASGKRMVSWGGCPLFPLEGWEDRSSHSVDGTARLDAVPEGAPLRVRLGVGDGTKVAFFPELFDPNDLQVEGIKRRWGETPPGLYYKAQLVALNPNTMAMASNGVLKTRTLYELEAQSDEEVDIGNQAWPIPKGPQVPQSILDEMEGREEDRENDPNGAYDPRFRDPRYASGPTGGHPQPGGPGNPFGPGGPQGPGVNPFSQGAPQGANGNPFAGAGAPHPQGFGPAPSPGFAGAPQGTPFAPPVPGGFPGAFGVQPGGYPGATPPGMGPMQAPPPPGFEWVWHAFPQGGGTMVLREVPKPPPPPPAEGPSPGTTTALVGLGTAALSGALALLEKWVTRPVAPAAPAQPSPLERIAEKMLTDRATQPAPAVDPKAIEASIRMEYEMRALRDQVTRLRETRPSGEPKQPASEDFLKQLERYKELAEKLNPSSRDEAQSTLGMIADLADTAGGKELLAKVGDGLARWLTAQPAPTYITAPAPVTAPAALPAPTAGPVASDAAVPTVVQAQPAAAPSGPDDGAPVLDPQGHVFCLDCGVIYALNNETAAAHAGHTFSRLTRAETLTEGSP